MITVTLDRLTIDPIEVQLPMVCPKCGRDFAEPRALVEVGFMASSRSCHVGAEGNVTTHFDLGENFAIEDELALATGYRCGGCNEVIVMQAPEHKGATSST